MSKSILLRDPTITITSDEAGTTVVKSVLPPPPNPGLYESRPLKPPRGPPPSLAYFCVRALLECPEQIHRLEGIQIRYELPHTGPEQDILHALIPLYNPLAFVDGTHQQESLDTAFRELNWEEIDPRLWAVIVQVFSNLPNLFYLYATALSDKHLPLLQQIPSTTHFSLVTVLDLPGQPELTDNTITQLKNLHTLCAIDASCTSLSAHGIARLANTLTWADDASGERRGPWGLRMLRLRKCSNIKDDVLPHLAAFPLLSVVDLRATKVSKGALTANVDFRPCPYQELHHPAGVGISLDTLATICALENPSCAKDASTAPGFGLFSSHTRPFVLSIHTLHNWRSRTLPRMPPPVNKENTVIVVPSVSSVQPKVSRTLRASSDCDSKSKAAKDVEVDKTKSQDVDMDGQLSDSDQQLAMLWQRVEATPYRADTTFVKPTAFYGSTGPSARDPPKPVQRPLPQPARPAIGDKLPSKDDEPSIFVLYRHPPPWSRLDEISQERHDAQRRIAQPLTSAPNEVSAKIGTALTLAGVRGVMAAIHQRKKATQPTSVAPAVVEAKHAARRPSAVNPFLKSSGQEASGPRAVGAKASQAAAKLVPLGTLDPGLSGESTSHAKKRPRLSTGPPPTCAQAFSSFAPNKPLASTASAKFKPISGRTPAGLVTAIASSSKRSVSGPVPVTAVPDSSMKMKAIGGRTPVMDNALKAISSTTRLASRTTTSTRTHSNYSDPPEAASSRSPSPEPATSKSILTQPVRTDKPLKRISELRIPLLPESAVRERQQRLAEEQAKAEAMRNKPKDLKQTHLRLRVESFGHSGVKIKPNNSGDGLKSRKRASDVGVAPTEQSKGKARRMSMPSS